MNGEDTGFTDKQGKAIHYGDILQVGLGISDRQRKHVVCTGNHPKLINADDSTSGSGGYALNDINAKQSVIIDHPH